MRSCGDIPSSLEEWCTIIPSFWDEAGGAVLLSQSSAVLQGAMPDPLLLCLIPALLRSGCANIFAQSVEELVSFPW